MWQPHPPRTSDIISREKPKCHPKELSFSA